MGLLDDRIAIVTGAARGIGRAVARRFAEEGAVVYGVDVVADELTAEMAALAERGLDAVAVPADVSSEVDVDTLVARVLAERGRIDVLANVAGIIIEKLVEDTTPAEWDRLLNVNLRGPFLLCRAAAPAMKRAGSGSIINVSSRAGAFGFATEVAYCASKWGIEGLSRALADELGPSGIAVNSITPGTPTHTSMSEITYGPEQRKIWKDPEVLGAAFVHLARQTPTGIHDRYIDAWKLSEALRNHDGWR
jgi:NAD(P)-dependent dehydrogenase (short-subunit alcohol dehydrogenase family)